MNVRSLIIYCPLENVNFVMSIHIKTKQEDRASQTNVLSHKFSSHLELAKIALNILTKMTLENLASKMPAKNDRSSL